MVIMSDGVQNVMANGTYYRTPAEHPQAGIDGLYMLNIQMRDFSQSTAYHFRYPTGLHEDRIRSF